MPSAPKPPTSELATGFGEKSAQSPGRFYRKDGHPNIIRKGVKFFDQLSWYHTMLELPRWKFWVALLSIYITINALFAVIYDVIGVDYLVGVTRGSALQNYIECFFFSTQTFTTVGYGHISPSGLLTSSVASMEAFMGVLSFALATGLFYGRFSRPRSFLKFSDMAIIAPYKKGTAFMFRTAPYKNNHLMDAEVKLTMGIRINRDGEEKNEFYTLGVEFNKINSLILNWTIVHPINENSPIYGFTLEDLKRVNAEFIVYVKAYDEGFANTVVARTSYSSDEIIEGARFKPMYYASESHNATVLDLNKLNDVERVSLPTIIPVQS